MTKNPGLGPSKSLRLRRFFLIFISEACDSDDGDPDVEFEAWKFRELQRLKRDREAREAEEAEQVTFKYSHSVIEMEHFYNCGMTVTYLIWPMIVICI